MGYVKNIVNVIGCGYSGIECALFLAGHDIKVNLFDYEGKHTYNCAKCSKRSALSPKRELFDALLKRELSFLGSPLIRQEELLKSQGYRGCTEGEIYNLGLEMVKNNRNIEYFNFPITSINTNEINIIASGNNTSESLSKFLLQKLGSMKCMTCKYKYPIITNIDTSKITFDGKNGFLHLDYDMYVRFVNKVIEKLNEKILKGGFKIYPKSLEDLALKGKDCLRNLCMMPVLNSSMQRKPYATLSIVRQDEGFLLCSIASNLDTLAQSEIIRTLPGFENAIILSESKIKEGLHVYPKYAINEFGQSKTDKNLFFTGSILGFEDYSQSIASGHITAMAVNNYFKDRVLVPLDEESMIGFISKNILKTNLSKSNDILQDYDIIEKQEDYTNEKLLSYLFDRSVKSLARFKEEYTSGKRV